MGKVIDSIKAEDGKFIYKLLMDQDELKHLYGNRKNIHIFSSNNFKNSTKILERGNHKGTKYFVIPMQMKNKHKVRPQKIMYQRIETPDETMFVYLVDSYVRGKSTDYSNSKDL